MDVETYQELGLHRRFAGGDFNAKVNGHSNSEILLATDAPEDRVYHPCAEARPGADVPRSTVRRLRDWQSERAFPDTKRDIWISTPPGLDDSDEPPAVLVHVAPPSRPPQPPAARRLAVASPFQLAPATQSEQCERQRRQPSAGFVAL